MGWEFSAKSLCVSVAGNAWPCAKSAPARKKKNSAIVTPKATFQKDAHLGQYGRFTAPKNIPNMCRETPNRAASSAKYKEKATVGSGGLTA